MHRAYPTTTDLFRHGLSSQLSNVRNLTLTNNPFRREVSQLLYSSITPTFPVGFYDSDLFHVLTPFIRSLIRRLAVHATEYYLPRKAHDLSRYPNLQHLILLDCPRGYRRDHNFYVIKSGIKACRRFRYTYREVGKGVVHVSSVELHEPKMEQSEVNAELEKCAEARQNGKLAQDLILAFQY